MQIPIYEQQATPELKSGQQWIRLVVHKRPTKADKEAEKLLRELAEAIQHSQVARKAYVLTVIRVDETEQRHFRTLPQILNGSSHKGISGVRKFVTSYVDGLRAPAIM